MIALLLIGGLIILTLGAEVLVRGAAKLALSFGISSLVVGLTVVAYGTSAPELFVSVSSAIQGNSDIALGNIIGSNIFNVLFILGICAVIVPLTVDGQLIRFDVPIMIGASWLALILALDGSIGRADGFLLVIGVIVYTTLSVVKSKQAGRVAEKVLDGEALSKGDSILKDVLLIAFGLCFLVLGANLFVNGAISLARILGISELLIGLTIVAAGTSLPEVATSIVAAKKGERDIAIGNIVGSNIFNILSVMGASALFNPINVASEALTFDIPIMIGVAMICFPVFYTKMTISRLEGALFLSYYFVYIAYLVLVNTQHHYAVPLGAITRNIVIPLTVVILAIAVTREWRSKRRGETGSRI